MGVSTSTLGDGIVVVAFPLLALTMTHRPILVAGVAVASQVPGLLVNPFAGAWMDRYDRRRLAMAAELQRLIIFVPFTVLVATGHASLLLLYVVVTLIGCCESVFLSCTTSSTPDVVADTDLELANGRLSAAEMTGRELVGQGVAGAAFALARALPFLLDSVCFAFSAAMAATSIPTSVGRRGTTSMRTDIRDGMRWFVRSRALVKLAGVIGVFAFCNGAVQSVLVLYATGPLHLGRAGYGLLLAGASVGGILASLVAGRVASRLGPVRTVVAGGFIAAVSYLTLALFARPLIAALAVSLESVGLLFGNVASLSLRQRLIPEHLRGRVLTSFRMVLGASVLLGAISGGVAVSVGGLKTCFAGAGLLQMAAVVVAMARRHSLDVDVDVTEPLSASLALPATYSAKRAAAAVEEWDLSDGRRGGRDRELEVAAAEYRALVGQQRRPDRPAFTAAEVEDDAGDETLSAARAARQRLWEQAVAVETMRHELMGRCFVEPELEETQPTAV